MDARPVPLKAVRVGVLGLGYVGAPLAAHFGRHFPTIGFDIDKTRVEELDVGHDRTRELGKEELKLATKLKFAVDPGALKDQNFFVVTVPTPIDDAKRPDLGALVAASETVGRVIEKGSVVVYESTVYPGATEEVCIPVIERTSNLRLNADFFAGYSPERMNPGDPEHRLPNVKKVVAGSSPAATDLIEAVYRKIITAGTHRVSSIRVAEAAKVIENVQRDVNIALVNELSQLFKRMSIEPREVLEAAETKWNYHYYRPGLVGGHCIGVDPYYLTHKAQSLGFHPEMILAGRRINDGMASYVAQDIIKHMLRKKLRVDSARILLMGLTFKQNCPDIRNTKIADLAAELADFGHHVTVHDPIADREEVERTYQIRMAEKLPSGGFDAVVLAVRHDCFAQMTEAEVRALLVPGGLVYDMKGVLPLQASDARL